MVRPPCCEKMGVKKGPWTPEEDHILVSYIERYGHENWRALPKQAGLLRCGKSCRLRWINYLRPDIKRGNFSKEEEETIIKLHEMMGNRWSAIATRLPGRTDNEIKNYWNTHLKKRVEQNLQIRNTLKRTVARPECRRHDGSDSEPEGSPSHLNIQHAVDHNSISAEAMSNTLLRSECCTSAATTRLVKEKSSKASCIDVTEIQGEELHDQFSSAASNFQGASKFQFPSGFASVPAVDNGSNVSNDMFFWYNIFINAGKT